MSIRKAIAPPDKFAAQSKLAPSPLVQPRHAVRVLAAESDFLRAAALDRIASKIDEVERCDFAHSSRAATRIAANSRPDLVLLGLTFTDLDGLDLIEILAASLPCTRLVVIAGSRDERTRAVLRHSANATYLDPALETPASLLSALRFAASVPLAPGRNRLSPSLVEPAGAPPPIDHFLSGHNQLVFSVLGAGYNDAQAALILGMELEALRSCRKRIMARLGVHSHPELMRLALQRGYVRITPEGVQHPGFEAALDARKPSAGCAMLA